MYSEGDSFAVAQVSVQVQHRVKGQFYLDRNQIAEDNYNSWSLFLSSVTPVELCGMEARLMEARLGNESLMAPVTVILILSDKFCSLGWCNGIYSSLCLPFFSLKKKISSDMTKHLVTSQMVYEAHQVLISAEQITAQRTQTRLIGAREVWKGGPIRINQIIRNNVMLHNV